MDHRSIEERSLLLARAIADRIDADPHRRGLAHARAVCQRWVEQTGAPAVLEWQAILGRTWPEIRNVLLDPSEERRRLRQSDPFCGVLSPREPWSVFQEYSNY